jgi:3-oxoacyl-[acyl-carrier protein] reductase
VSLDGKIALVTGASRGIGQAIAQSLGKQGATVVGTSTTQAGSDGIGQQLSAAAVKGTGMTLNVADAAQCEAVVAEIQKRFGEIAILVNNAGVTRDNLLVRMKDEEWEAVIDTDLKSIYRLSKLVLRSMMKARYGRIINITSVIGATGNAGQANYAAAKAGVVGFSKSLAREVGSRNITVHCIAPGFKGALRAAARRVARADPPRPSRQAGGRGVGGGVPGLARGGLHDRMHPSRERRHVSGISVVNI